jgi:hypothetical protein
LLNSQIDDVCIYDRALSGEEIGDLYNDTKGCADPAGRAGEMFYNTALKILQYCDGKYWVWME